MGAGGMSYAALKAGPVFWRDGDKTWTADAPHDAVAFGVGAACPECGNRKRIVDTVDFGLREYLCAPNFAIPVPPSLKARHAIPERWYEIERGDPPRLIMHLGEAVQMVAEMRRRSPEGH